MKKRIGKWLGMSMVLGVMLVTFAGWTYETNIDVSSYSNHGAIVDMDVNGEKQHYVHMFYMGEHMYTFINRTAMTANGKRIGELYWMSYGKNPYGVNIDPEMTIMGSVDDADAIAYVLKVYSNETMEGTLRFLGHPDFTMEQTDGKTDYIKCQGNTFTVDIGAIARSGGGTVRIVASRKDDHWKYGFNPYAHESRAPINFSDVKQGAWYYDAVKQAYEYGMISGYGNGKFGPTDKVSYAQMAQMVFNYNNDPEPSDGYKPFNEHWSNYAMCYATMGTYDQYWDQYRTPKTNNEKYILNEDITYDSSTRKGNFDDAMTREQAAHAMGALLRHLGVQKVNDTVPPDIDKVNAKYRDNVLLAYQCGMVKGVDDAGNFSPKSGVTRAEVCQMFVNAGLM